MFNSVMTINIVISKRNRIDMIIELLKEDSSELVLDYLENLFFNIYGEVVSFPTVSDFEASNYKCLSLKTFLEYENLKIGEFFLFHNDSDARELIEGIAKKTPNCLGVINLDRGYEIYLPFIGSFLKNHKSIVTQQKLQNKLNGVIQSILAQLQRVQSLHNKLTPIRNEELRGINVKSRFCAGTSTGGEFFDSFKIGNRYWIISITALSYVAIGSLLSIIEKIKSSNSLTQEKIFRELEADKEELKDLGGISLFIAEIDITTYDMTITNVGGHELVSRDQIISARNSDSYPVDSTSSFVTSYKLKKGESLVLLSPGFFKNTDGSLKSGTYLDFIHKNWSNSADFIQELTYQSKSKYNDLDFMPFDQNILIIGVDKNAISQV